MCEGVIVGYRKFGGGVSKGGERARRTWRRQIGRQRTIATRDEWEFYTKHCGNGVVGDVLTIAWFGSERFNGVKFERSGVLPGGSRS